MNSNSWHAKAYKDRFSEELPTSGCLYIYRLIRLLIERILGIIFIIAAIFAVLYIIAVYFLGWYLFIAYGNHMAAAKDLVGETILTSSVTSWSLINVIFILCLIGWVWNKTDEIKFKLKTKCPIKLKWEDKK